MKFPSASGIVFASLAISGTSLAAPTGFPSSPTPNSPNPGLDSPRLADSPDLNLNSPRSLNQAFFVGRSRQSTPRRSRVSRKRDVTPPPAPHGLPIDALGIAPDPSDLSSLFGTVSETAGDAIVGIPGVGTVLGSAFSQVTDKAIDVSEKLPSAAAMTRSPGHMFTRGNGGVNAQGLGIGAPVKGVLDTVGGITKGLPVVGKPLSDAIGKVGDTVGSLSTKKHPRTVHHRRDVKAEGLGDTVGNVIHTIGGVVDGVVPGTGKVVNKIGDTVSPMLPRDGGAVSSQGLNLGDVLHSIGDGVDRLVPGVGDVVKKVGDTVGPLVPRNIELEVDPTVHPRAVPDLGSPFNTVTSKASDFAGATPAGTVVNTAGGVIQGSPLGSTLGSLASTFMTADGRVFQEVGKKLPSGAQVVPQTLGSVASTASNSAGRVVSTISGRSPVDPIEVLPGQVKDVPSSGPVPMVAAGAGKAVGIATGVKQTISNTAANTPVGQAISGNASPGVVGFLPDGKPVFGAASSGFSQVRGTAQGPASQVVDTASTVGQTASGTVSNTPGGGVLDTAKGVFEGTPAKMVLTTAGDAAVGAVGNAPVVGQSASGAASTAKAGVTKVAGSVMHNQEDEGEGEEDDGDGDD